MHDDIAFETVPARLVAGVLEHLACYLQTGRTRSARQAMVLLGRLSGDAEAEPCLREHGGRLAEVLEDRLAALPSSGPQEAVRANPRLAWERAT